MSWLSALPSTTRTLDFSQRPIRATPEGRKHMVGLSGFPNLVRLDLSNNRQLISIQFEYIGQILSTIPSFKELVIKRVDGVDLVDLLHPLVVKKIQLRVLNLSRTRFLSPVENTEAAMRLGNAINKMHELEVLKLPDCALNHFNTLPLPQVEAYFLGATNLRSLSLGQQAFFEPATTLCILDSLVRLTKLERLALGGMFHIANLNDEIFERLKYTLSQLTLTTSFSLENAALPVDRCVALTQALPSHTNFTSLNLSTNFIYDDEIKQLQSVFVSKPYLTKLDLSMLGLENVSESNLSETLMLQTELRTLKLNVAGLKQCEGIIKYAVFNTNLTKLELGGNTFSVEARANLVDQLPQMSVGDLRLGLVTGCDLDTKVKGITELNRYNHMRKACTLFDLLVKSLYVEESPTPGSSS